MDTDIPHACDVNVALQHRMHQDMDTCAFTAVRPERADDRRGDRGADDPRAGRAGRAEQAEQAERAGQAGQWQQQPEMPWPEVPWQPEPQTALPTWVVVLGLALALALAAQMGKRR
jgi:hypothetical protein